MFDETSFHISVMEWLHKNGYRFFWECPLPNSRKRPDFLAISSTGERYLFECKLNYRQPYSANITQIRDYLALLNDKDVKPFLVYPEGSTLRAKTLRQYKDAAIDILYVPFVDLTRTSGYVGENRNRIADFFPTYQRKELIAQNVWGQWILGL